MTTGPTLNSALYTSFTGLRATEAEISVAGSNVTNADKDGYTRKTYDNRYFTSIAGTVPIGGSIQSEILDPYLLEAVIEDTSDANYSTTISDYLSRYVDSIGDLDNETSISATMDQLTAAFDQLSVTPEDSGVKGNVVTSAQNVAYSLRDMADNIQDLRAQADLEITQMVLNINDILATLEDLNVQISQASANGSNTADLNDERNVYLEELSSMIDLQYFIDGDNEMSIYAGGRFLLGSSGARTLEYSGSPIFNSGLSYPANIDGITIDGSDITTNISGGKIAALIELRDTILVEEQAKLDEFTGVLTSQINELMNHGGTLPPRNSMTGDVQNLQLTDTYSSTGTVRIAVTDQTGTVVNFVDIDTATTGTVTAVINAINAGLGADATATLTANGQLQISASTATTGIIINNNTSSDAADGLGFGTYFGLNNLFDAQTGSEDIQVSEYLRDAPDYVPTSRFSAAAGLAIGDVGIYQGDGDLAKEINEAFTTQYSFASAGNFIAQTQTLDNYADLIISNAAVQANSAVNASDTKSLILEGTKSDLQNLTGVNVDEEMANIINLEAQYQAAATLVATIQQMFDELLLAVR